MSSGSGMYDQPIASGASPQSPTPPAAPLRLAIAGATGRMGQMLVRLAAADPACRLVATTTIEGDPLIGQDAGRIAGLNPLGVTIATRICVPCDALIEFTSPSGTASWAQWCAAEHVALVSGTTGLGAAEHAALRAAAAQVPVVWAPNMSTGVNLLLALVSDVAARLGADWDIEIVETHHRRKVDAPSGTARALLEAAAAARDQSADAVATHGRSGLIGPRPAGQIGVHAVRMGAIVGEHAVHFTSESESLTLAHRAFAREAFAAGALRAARWVAGRPPGLYAMRDVLGL
ncbi:MAG: 4-hydroxy-tetrahydrodipicolinate reductase [Planctomycetota bacterium]